MSLRIRSQHTTVSLALFVIAFASVGTFLLFSSRASTPTASVEPESGTVAGNSLQGTDDTTASGGYVKFGTKDLSVRVSNGALVNKSGQQLQLLGVNFASTHDNCRTSNSFSYVPVTDASAQAIASWHSNAVRLTLNESCWLGINGAVLGGSAYQNAVKSWVTKLNNAGIRVILSLQIAAPGTELANYQNVYEMPNTDHSPDFWNQVATAYKSNPSVLFDLYNEPSLGGATPTSANWDCWLNGCTYTHSSVTYQVAGMQQLVNTVRATGAQNVILVGGLRWAGDPCSVGSWHVTSPVTTCLQFTRMPTDPQHQLAVSQHMYKTHGCSDQSCWDPVQQASATYSIPVITGEFGQYDCQSEYLASLMNWSDTHKVSYLAWTWQNQALANGVPNALTSVTLLSNTNGTPGTYCPVGTTVHDHLIQQNP